MIAALTAEAALTFLRIESASSTTIRSAVFLPTPGIFVSAEESPATIVSISSSGLIPEITLSAPFGPIPETESNARNSSFSKRMRNP